MKKLASLAMWIWIFPSLIFVNGYYAFTEYASFVVHSPMHAWRAAQEAVENLQG